MDDLKECREAFEAEMIALHYPENMFEGFMAEGEWAYYDPKPNMMFDAWQAAWNRRAVPQANAEQDAQDKIDAARYRHMRNLNVEQAGAAGQPSIALPSGLNHGYYLTEETADYAIDESIKERAASKTTPSSGEGGNGDH